MIFNSKYQITINKESKILKEMLLAKTIKPLYRKNLIGSDTMFSLNDDYDQFILRVERELFDGRRGDRIESVLKIVKKDENSSFIDVKIRLESLTYVFLGFFYFFMFLAMILGTNLKLYGYVITSLGLRILFFSAIIVLLNFIIWMMFVFGKIKYEEVILDLCKELNEPTFQENIT
jgi:hypothetical protein